MLNLLNKWQLFKFYLNFGMILIILKKFKFLKCLNIVVCGILYFDITGEIWYQPVARDNTCYTVGHVINIYIEVISWVDLYMIFYPRVRLWYQISYPNEGIKIIYKYIHCYNLFITWPIVGKKMVLVIIVYFLAHSL